MNWKPTDEDRDAAAGEWSVGDRVTARTNEIKVRTGSRGTVVSFSSCWRSSTCGLRRLGPRPHPSRTPGP